MSKLREWWRDNWFFVGIWTLGIGVFALAIVSTIVGAQNDTYRSVDRQCAVLTTLSQSKRDSLVARLACDAMHDDPDRSSVIAVQAAEKLGGSHTISP